MDFKDETCGYSWTSHFLKRLSILKNKVMVFRNFCPSDLSKIEELSKQLGFPAPTVAKALFNGIVSDEDGIIAYGQIEPIIEATIILNQERDIKIRTQALKRLMPYAIHQTYKNGYKQLHGFIKNKEFGEIMKKHYNFQRTGGESLVLNL